MKPEDRLEQLLDVWMADRDRGVTRAVTELCAEFPELVPELSRRIQVVSRFQQLADVRGTETLAYQSEVNTSHSTNAPAPVPLIKNTRLPAAIGNFKPLEILGEGGMGAVYLAEDPQLGRQVAVKVMKKELAADPDAKHRFLREARAMAKIEHDNIMTIYAVGEDRGMPFLVMPVLKGETLDDRLQREDRLSVAESCRIGREISAGLAAAHAHGLVHRDIKPSNIWLEGIQGRVRILDFGLARPITDDHKVTQSGTVLGTPAYMAPEQAAGTEATSRSDLFSLGAVMYRMTTGQQPFAGPNVMATLNNLANRNPEPPQRINPEVPSNLSGLIQQLISKTPEERPVSAMAVLESLQGAETISLPTITIVPIAPKSSNREVRAARTKTKSTPKPQASSDGRSTGVPLIVFLGGLAGFLLLFAAVVYRIQTDNGTLILTIEDDDQVEAKLNENGLVIEDARTGRTWHLTPNKPEPMPSGDYKLPKVQGLLLSVTDDAGTEFNTAEFKIKRGDRATVRVRLEGTAQDPEEGSAEGYSVRIGEPWKSAPLSGYAAEGPGKVRAAWSGPNGSSVVVLTQEPVAAIHPRDLLESTAAAQRHGLGATVGVEAVRSVAGMQAMSMVAHGKGSGTTIDGTGRTPTTQHWVAVPRERDVFILRLTCPSKDYPIVRTSFEAAVDSLILTGSQTDEQKSDKAPKAHLIAIRFGESPLDVLEASQIPEEERLAYLPKETVAVLGTHAQKTWGSPFYTTHGNLSYSPDGKWICACDFSNVYLFDAVTFRLRKQIPQGLHFLSYRPFAFSANSSKLCLGLQGISEIASGSVTDLSLPELPTSVLAELSQSYVIANSPDDRLVAMAGYASSHELQLGIRDPDTNHVSNLEIVPDVAELPKVQELGAIREVAFSPDGMCLIAGHYPGGYQIYRKQDHKFIPVAVIPSQMPIYNARVAFSFTSDHKQALLLGADVCYLLDLSLLDEFPPDLPLPTHSKFELEPPKELNGVVDFSISADGQTWAASKNNPGAGAHLLIGNWVNGRPGVVSTIVVPGTVLGHVALSPNGKSLAAMGENRFLRVFDLTQNPPLERTASQFTSTSIAGDGRVSVTVGSDGVIQLNSLNESNFQLMDSQTVDRAVGGAGVSSDDKRAVTITRPDVYTPMRSRIQIWNIEQGALEELSIFEASEDRMWSPGALFADGSRFLYGNQIWDVTTASAHVITEFSRLHPKPAASAVSEDGSTMAFASSDGRLSIYAADGATGQPLVTDQLSSPPASLSFSPDGKRIVTTFAGGNCTVWDLADRQLIESIRLPGQWDIAPHGPPYHMTSAVFSRDAHRVYFAGWGGLGEWNLDENKVTRFWSLPGFAWLTMAADGRHLFLNNSNCTTWILRITSP